MQLKPNCPIGAKRGEKIFYLFFSSKFAVTLLRSTAIACNVSRLCVRRGIESNDLSHGTKSNKMQNSMKTDVNPACRKADVRRSIFVFRQQVSAFFLLLNCPFWAGVKLKWCLLFALFVFVQAVVNTCLLILMLTK